jgi:Raf kinase inhibitor-like YbhB/YbcL family protein
MKLTSSAFDAGRPIPKRHTGEGEDVSPSLAFQAPSSTRELCLECDDPDAPKERPFVHWLVAGIPGDARSLPESVEGLVFGRNDFGKEKWGGPMPPKGHGVHHYHFRLHALNAPSGLAKGFTQDELRDAIRGKVIESAELVGTYERRADG